MFRSRFGPSQGDFFTSGWLDFLLRFVVEILVELHGLYCKSSVQALVVLALYGCVAEILVEELAEGALLVHFANC
jgi:hypothetical protein